LREACGGADLSKLKGIIEIDETFVIGFVEGLGHGVGDRIVGRTIEDISIPSRMYETVPASTEQNKGRVSDYGSSRGTGLGYVDTSGDNLGYYDTSRQHGTQPKNSKHRSEKDFDFRDHSLADDSSYGGSRPKVDDGYYGDGQG
jgi:hypothetical protein